jgi:hypothetical protein
VAVPIFVPSSCSARLDAIADREAIGVVMRRPLAVRDFDSPGSTQKPGFWNAAPVAQKTGYG